LRFLDFLIHDPEPAIVLYDMGIPVLVPAPQRFALHKLIVSRRRQAGNPKRDKDMQQAEALIEILAQKRPFELAEAWREACGRGPTWRQLLLEALSIAEPEIRDALLKIVEEPRASLPKFDVRFDDETARHDFDRKAVRFNGRDIHGRQAAFLVSDETLRDHFDAKAPMKEECLKAFQQNRAAIERIARHKYLYAAIADLELTVVTAADVEEA
jgi:hypothetical protein